MQGADKELSQEIGELNIKLKKYCLGRGFIYINSNNINEYCMNNGKLCLNNSKLYVNDNDTNLFSNNI